MSVFRKTGRRCDWCGKFTMSHDGEYLKPDGVSAGYILCPGWERDPGKDEGHDICEECGEDRCPKCGGDQVVKVTPSIPGPYGWGGRCKSCRESWSMPVSSGEPHPTEQRS